MSQLVPSPPPYQPTDGYAPDAARARGFGAYHPGSSRHAPDDGGDGGFPFDPQQVVKALLRRWWVVTAFGAVAAGAAWGWTRTQPVTYRARAIVQLSAVRQDLASDALTGKQATDPTWEQFGTGQLAMVRSDAVVGEVVDAEPFGVRVRAVGFPGDVLRDVSVDSTTGGLEIALRFEAGGVRMPDGSLLPYGQPAAVRGVRFAVARRPAAEELAADATPAIAVVPRVEAMAEIAHRISAKPREKSLLVDIGFVDADADVARRIVNRTSLALQSYATRLTQQQSRQRRVFVADQLARVDSQLFAAEFALSAFRARQRAYSASTKFSSQQSEYEQLLTRERELTASRDLATGLLRDLQDPRAERRTAAVAMLASSQEIGTNTMVGEYVRRLANYQNTRAELLGGPQARTAAHPDVARVDSLIAAAQTGLAEAVRSHVGMLEAQQRIVAGRRTARERELGTLPAANAEEAQLLQNVAALQSQGSLLREELQKARIAEAAAVGPVEILDLESSPRPVDTGGPRLAVLAGLLGAGLGGLLVVVPVVRDRSLKRRRDVEAAVRLPVLATIPRLEPLVARRAPRFRPGARARLGGAPTPPPTALVKRDGRDAQVPGAEAYRHLRAILFAGHHEGSSPRKVVVTSALPAEGKTSVTVNLATTLSRQGWRVLLIDGDLRAGRLHRVFGLTAGPGLHEALTEGGDPSAVIRQDPTTGLSLMTVGAPDERTSDLLAGPRMRAMLNELARQFDVVMVDSPPVLAVADASVLGAAADAVLLVVRAGKTTAEEATEAARHLAHAGAPLAGAVFNDPDARSEDGAHAGYYYYQYAGAGRS